MDEVNAEFGASVVYLGAMHGMRGRGPDADRVHADPGLRPPRELKRTPDQSGGHFSAGGRRRFAFVGVRE